MSQSFELLGRLEGGEAEPDFAAPELNLSSKQTEVTMPGSGPLAPELFELTQSLFLSSGASGPRTVVLCGVGNTDGSSSVCADLARVLCGHGRRSVCVIDANSGGGTLSTLFTSSRERTIRPSKYSAASVPVLLSRSVLEDPQDGILLPADAALAKVRGAFDYVLIDAPGANVSADAIAIGRAADGAILVIKANSTRRKAAVQAVKKLSAANIRVLGIVLTCRTFPIPGFLYRKF